MVSLLERFYDPAQGSVLLDGVDIKVSIIHKYYYTHSKHDQNVGVGMIL